MKRLKWFSFLILTVKLRFSLCFSSINNEDIGKLFHDKFILNPSFNQSIYSTDKNFYENELKGKRIYDLKGKLIRYSILKSDQKLIKDQSKAKNKSSFARRNQNDGYDQNDYSNALNYRSSINQPYSTQFHQHYHLINPIRHSKIHYTDNPCVYNSPNYKPKPHQPYKPVKVHLPKKVNPLLILSQDIERISETVLFASMPRPISKRIIRIIDGHLGLLKGSKNTHYDPSDAKFYGGILAKPGKPIEHG